MARDLYLLSEDAKITSVKQGKTMDTKKIPSLKSMQPVTRIYKSKEEIKESKENPEVANIIAKTYDIFKG